MISVHVLTYLVNLFQRWFKENTGGDRLSQNEHLPNFFDSLQEYDIEDFLQDHKDFSKYGYSHYHSS